MAINMDCPECGGRFKVRDELVGRRVKCPKCGETVAVADPGDEPEATGSPRRGQSCRADDEEEMRPRRGNRPRDDDDDSDYDRPRKKSKKGLVIGLCAGGGALLVGIVVLIIIAVLNIKSQAEQTRLANDLRSIGVGYHNYSQAFGKGPANAEELRPFLGGESAESRLRKEDIVLIYGVHIADLAKEGNIGNTILGYHRDAPTRGGYVLFGDAQVRELSAEEFGKTPQARPKQ